LTVAEDVQGSFQVKGLRQALDNMRALPKLVKINVGRAALRAAAHVVEGQVKARTYTTFNRLTGAIGASLGVRVGMELKGETLNAVIGEYPVAMSGATPMAQAFNRTYRARASMYAGKPMTAYWWRYLEFGTRARHAKMTPRFMRRSTTPRTERQVVQVNRWTASAGRGAVASRSWVRPALADTAASAVEMFRQKLNEGIETEVNRLQK
jgi:HK97 gp10 family phage protein